MCLIVAEAKIDGVKQKKEGDKMNNKIHNSTGKEAGLPGLCPTCGADLKAWREMFGEQHRHYEQRKGDKMRNQDYNQLKRIEELTHRYYQLRKHWWGRGEPSKRLYSSKARDILLRIILLKDRRRNSNA